MSQKIYVGNLGFSVTNQELTDKFSRFGLVTSARIVLDRDTSRSKGFAYIEMSNNADAARAIQKLNGADMYGRQMSVTEARPPGQQNRFLKKRF